MTSLFPFNDYFLTRTVKLGHLHIVSYGTKVSVLAGNGSGYKYPGSFVYSVSSGGTETLESIACDEGKITVSYRTGSFPRPPRQHPNADGHNLGKPFTKHSGP